MRFPGSKNSEKTSVAVENKSKNETKPKKEKRQKKKSLQRSREEKKQDLTRPVCSNLLHEHQELIRILARLPLLDLEGAKSRRKSNRFLVNLISCQ